MAAICGIPPSDLLRAGPIERQILLDAVVHAQEYLKTVIRAQAVECVNAYAEAVKRGK